MDYKIHILENGIRLIHVYKNSAVAHCGLIINTGSRDEVENEHGIAHFIEHVIFKGTKKRKLFHLLSRMEDVGGEIDAYTSKEETWIYSTFLPTYYERSVELISDIVFNSIFPEKEIEKEKVVVMDEINSYKDSPSELIYDDFEDMVFANHPLGRNILGTKKTIRSFNQDTIKNFISKEYNTDQMILCSVGNIPFDKLVKYFIKHYNHIPKNIRKTERSEFSSYFSETKEIRLKTYQAHCIIGNVAYSSDHSNRLGLLLINNILGGNGMNSRLNLSLREKNGLVYHVESNYTRYSDTGIWNIYFGTDKENLRKCIDLVFKELQFLKLKKMGTIQLHKAKRQMIGQLAISADNNM
ncbi:MAG: pitrilysin family protein, partial [Bacteroidota bacterium]